MLNKIDVADDAKSISVEWIADGISHRRAFTIYDKPDFKLSVADLNPKIYTCLSPQLPAPEATEENPSPVAPERFEVIFYDNPPAEFEIIRAAKTIDILEWQEPVDARPDWLKSAPLVDTGKPQEVTRGQAKIALARAGLLNNVTALIATLPADSEVRIWWEDAQVFRRASPALLEMAEALELDSDALDQLFVSAAAIDG